MGGRGTNLNVSTYLAWDNERQQSEYRTIYKKGNIVFLIKNSSENDSTSAPIFSHHPNRIYVTISNGQIQSVTFYNENHIQVSSIHPGHAGEPKIHEHGPLTNRTHIEITKEHKEIYDDVFEIFNKEVKMKL